MLSIDSISKSFGQTTVLESVSLTVEQGEIVALLGPSGSGKSTLLRIIAGLETADRGMVSLGGKDLRNIPPESRGIGMVFQSLALFPHLDVAGNIRYGLNKGENLNLVDIMLGTVGLSGFGGRRIDSLSGGEAQRVALARSLIAKPYLMLLDEPLSSLDSDLKHDLADAVRTILKSTKTPAIHVTHDVSVAEILADRVLKIAELSAGRGN